MALRDQARQRIIDAVPEAAEQSHKRNYHKLHVMRDGTVSWFEAPDQASDIIDRQAKGFAAIPSVARTGTGGFACNCDYCDSDYASQDDAIADAIANSDLSGIEADMLAKLDKIAVGYFDDEEQSK